ncbi:MAG: FAD-dependent oxidoreductase [Tannerellaceae bacterium]|jgi:hypothetical protein|nr:FAD-dependent oxidoreductase [Tannerellaceae bacterium]
MKKFNRKDFIKAAAGIVSSTIYIGCSLDGSRQSKISTLHSLPKLEADVIVVGAGPSGIPAAIAAARQGAKVILVEQDLSPGGAPVNMFVSMLCGGPRLGIYREMVQYLNAHHTISGKPKDDFGEGGANGKNHWYLPSSFMMTVSQMLAKEKNISLMLDIEANGVILEEKGSKNIVKGIRINRMGALQDIYAPVTIDATGTGLLGELSGAPVMYGRDGREAFGETIGSVQKDEKVQRCTWMYVSQKLRDDAVLPWDDLISDGMVEDDLSTWVKAHHVDRKTGIYLHWGATVICHDTRDPIAIGQAQQECLKTLVPDIQTLNKAGFQIHLAPKMGIREVRRIRGEYVITTNDMRDGTYPNDTIAYTSYGLDPWGEDIPEAERKTLPHGIPYRSLIPLNVEGLLIAGKAISGTHLAASGYRVQPIVASIGQAAGTAAAMASLNKTSVRNIEIKKLLKSLEEQGLFLKKEE